MVAGEWWETHRLGAALLLSSVDPGRSSKREGGREGGEGGEEHNSIVRVYVKHAHSQPDTDTHPHTHTHAHTHTNTHAHTHTQTHTHTHTLLHHSSTPGIGVTNTSQLHVHMLQTASYTHTLLSTIRLHMPNTCNPPPTH